MFDRPMLPSEQSLYEYEKAPASMGQYLTEVNISNKVVLDFGCGWGGETAWLREQGAKKVIGIDVDEDSLEQARAFTKHNAIEFTSRIESIETDSIDYVFSTNVFEHVMDLSYALDQIYRILRPGGALLTRFGPLFYSPYGCHFYWAKLFPWSHVLLGRRWLVRRIDAIRGYPSAASSWEELGMNRVTFKKFEKIVRSKPFRIMRLQPLPVAGLPLVTRLPLLRTFLTFGCDVFLAKP